MHDRCSIKFRESYEVFVNITNITYPKPLSFELSQGSKLRLVVLLTLPGKLRAIASRFPLGGRPGLRAWILGTIVGAVHIVIFILSPEIKEEKFIIYNKYKATQLYNGYNLYGAPFLKLFTDIVRLAKVLLCKI